MRILMTTDTVGGVWNFATSLCAALCGGNEVALVSFGGAPSQAHQSWIRGMRRVQDGFFHFTASEIPLEWMQDNEHATEGGELLASIATDFHPDVLHTSQFCWGALPRTGALDIPRVITAHSDVLSWAQACRAQGLEPSEWIDLYRELVQQGLDGADAVIAPTQWMLDALQANFNVHTHKCSVIPNGARSPERSPDVQRKRQIITAGRFWDEGKNLSLLEDLHSSFPIICAGDGLEPGSSALQSLGVLSSEELHRHFSESELYLCPSLYEPFGLAPLEAALRGCALVLHDIPSLREVWGDAALYFSSKPDLEALLLTLWHNPRAVTKSAARASSRAARYTLSSTAKGYAELYNRVVISRGAGQAVAYA